MKYSLWAFLVLGWCAALGQAAPRAAAPELQRWPGRRVVMVLPLQVGAGWNLDRVLTNQIIPAMEEELHKSLYRTGKLSPFRMHRSNPLFLRALQDRRMTQEELNKLLDPASTTPMLERARLALAKFTFEQPPLIADFRLEEVRASGSAKAPSVQIQITGRLHETGTGQPTTSVVTSPQVRMGTTATQKVTAAAALAFRELAAQFVAPLEDFVLPVQQPEPQATPAVAAPQPTPATPTLVPGSPEFEPVPAAAAPPANLPGDVPIAGSSTKGSPLHNPFGQGAAQPARPTGNNNRPAGTRAQPSTARPQPQPAKPQPQPAQPQPQPQPQPAAPEAAAEDAVEEAAPAAGGDANEVVEF